MIKKDGKVYADIAEKLRAKGINTDTLEVATLGRGTDHLVILSGETVGEYNHNSEKLILYRDFGL